MRTLAILLIVSFAAADVRQDPDVLTRSRVTSAQRIAALSALWREAAFSFAYYDKIAADWDRLYQEFIPRVQSATSDYEYYLELMRFYAHLHDGHSGIFWPREFDEALGSPPFEIRKIEGRAVIFRILRETEELNANRIQPGLEVLEVDKRPVAELVDYWRALKTGSTPQATDRKAYFRILTGPRNTTVNAVVQEPGRSARTVRLTRSEAYFNDTNLEPPRPFFSREVLDGIGYFAANQMSHPVAEAFAKYIESARGMNGLILDVRYNGGGSDVVAAAMIARLIDQPIEGQTYEVTSYRPDRRAFRQEQEVIRTKQGKIAPARGARFTGRVVVLIGEQTHSAAEGGLLSVIRARPQTIFVGEKTAGSTGQPLIFDLPGGGIGVVCSRRNGFPFVGVGFEPDVHASLSQQDLFAGRDSVLDRAIEILKRPAN